MTWQELVSDSGPLLAVRGTADRNGSYSVIEFTFEEGTLRLEVDADTDEVRVSVVRGDAALDPLDAQLPFAGLQGRSAESAWTMTNQRGYSDGFQLRLVDGEDRSEATVQAEAAASSLFITRA